jgi:hypothetical protein
MVPVVNYKKFLPFLLAFVLPLVIVYAWWGGFNPVTLATEVRGPYTYAYLEHTGDYAKLPEALGVARKTLEDAGIRPGPAFTLLYSNPEVVRRADRRARVGYLVEPGIEVPDPLQLDTLPAREVLTARVRAAILLAPSRAYQALDDHLQARGKGIRMPTVEIYEDSASVLTMGVLTVEVMP